jgi:hypothetical protein
MSQRTVLKNKGLFTDPNQLSGLPDGAMVKAENVVIDRDDVVSSRRGMAQYGNTFGAPDKRAKQLLTYKDRILFHYDDKLLFNDNPHNNTDDGNFLQFSGSYSEIDSGLRIKAIESNKNLFFTTADGIKKISAKTADDFTTAANYIVDAGAVKALDVTGSLESTTEGFLPPNSEVAYRVVWSYKDANDNLIAGTPSSRLVMSNYSGDNSNINLSFVIPQNITSDYFYQVYRSAVFTATGSLTLDDIDPGDELQLVIEDFPSAAQISAGSVTVTDIAPEDFRAGGLPLYTNPNAGDGIASANEPPPKAKDLTMYQSTVFYANTESRARTTLALLGVEDLVSGTSTITIDSGTPQVYTFRGVKEQTEIDFSSFAPVFPGALATLNGKYFLINSASDQRKYYVWFDNTKTEQIIDFTSYAYTVVADIKANLKEKFFVLHTKDADRKYYVWYDSTGTDTNPGNDPANGLAGYGGIRVNISAIAALNDVATLTNTAISTGDVNVPDDFDTAVVGPIVTVTSESFDDTAFEVVETIQSGFSFTFNTAVDADPEIVGRFPIRVNISRHVSSKATLADATAAAILEQDTALDFEVTYVALAEDFTILNTNNGNTTDAADGNVANGFAITVLVQGDGEDAATKEVLLSAAASPAQRIDETARSLVNIINRNPNSTVYAFYISGPTDLPGQFLLETKDIGVNQFTVVANNAATGDSFNPALPPSVGAATVEGKAEIKPNRIYFAKLQQPEAVPALNFIDVGPEDRAISRVLALRESLFLLKEEGVYRLTGSNGAYSVDLFDSSARIIAPDSAVVLNNQIYCLTNLGIVAISDTGVSVISNQIAGTIQVLTSANYTFKAPSFGVSYENDYAYILFMPASKNDTVATFAFRYSTQTQAFTTFKMSKTCGLVNPGDDKLYLGPADKNFIERERKVFNRTDYADRQFDLIIPSNSVNGDLINLSSSSSVSIGDAIIQTQYLTIAEYNQLLKKIDLDPSIGEAEETRFDFTSYVGAIPSSLHSNYFFLYAASDARKYCVFYDAQGDLTELDTDVFTDVSGSIQIRVDISSGISTLAQLTEATKIAIQSATLDFVVTHSFGNTYFDTRTVKNGNTTDAYDGANGIGSGFSITVLTQGMGDYYSALQMVAGNNVFSKLSQLAIKLDADPGVVQNDFVAAIAPYTGSGTTFIGSQTGVTATLGTPTSINTVTPHGLITGDNVVITASTTTPTINGTYAVTVTSSTTFTVPVTTTVGGTLSWADTKDVTIINDPSHNIQTGRVVSIITSTPDINADYVATRIDADNFSIPLITTVNGVCTWEANMTTFEEAQGGFNTIVNKLNVDTGVSFQNYLQSSGAKEFEVLVIDKADNTSGVYIQFTMPFVEGPITVYEGIACDVQYAPETFGDTSLLKQVSEGTVIFEDNNFSRATVGYRSDLSPGVESIDFTKSGKGDYGFFIFSEHNWGGGFSGVPLRTYIPRQKQRCRYIQLNFIHDSAREIYSLYGFSYTFRAIGEKAYRS